MTAPSADPANTASIPEAAAIPARILQDGEIVILAIKSSGWYVVLSAMPMIALVMIVMGIVYFVQAVTWGFNPRTIIFLCLLFLSFRMLIGCFYWFGRWYILTNLRLIQVGGLSGTEIFQCSLKQVQQVRLTSTAAEKTLGLGTLTFDINDPQVPAIAWLNIQNPQEVHQIVIETIRKFQSRSGNGKHVPPAEL